MRTLLMVVGFPQRPFCAGNGGFTLLGINRWDKYEEEETAIKEYLNFHGLQGLV